MEKLKRLTIKINLLLVVLLILNQSYAQTKCLSLGEIYSKIEKKWFYSPRVVRYEKFRDFDFVNFVPDNKTYEDNYFIIGYDSINRIVSIEHIEKEPKLSEFKFLVFDFPTFKMLTYQIKRQSGEYFFNPGIFVLDKKIKRYYFLNIKKQFGRDASPGYLYEQFPIVDFKQLSAIMILRDDLYPEFIVRFSEGRGLIASKMIYSESMELTGEMMDLLVITDDVTVNRSSCLNDIQDKVDCCRFTMTVKPKMNPKYKKVPLWILNGSHSYE